MSAFARMVERQGRPYTLTTYTAGGTVDDYGDRMSPTPSTTSIKGFPNPGVGREQVRVTVRGREYFIDMSVVVLTSDVSAIRDEPEVDEDVPRATLTDAYGNTWEIVAIGRAGDRVGASRLMCVQKTA